MLFRRIKVGDPLPGARLAVLEDGEVSTLSLAELCAQGTALIVGMPGAFTPVCAGRHLPNVLANVERLRRSGIDRICILARNDPWVMAEWRQRAAPDAPIMFLSDGNLEFGTRCGLVEENTPLFLGRTLKRFTMIARNALVEKMAVEETITDFVCTTTDPLLTN